MFSCFFIVKKKVKLSVSTLLKAARPEVTYVLAVLYERISCLSVKIVKLNILSERLLVIIVSFHSLG